MGVRRLRCMDLRVVSIRLDVGHSVAVVSMLVPLGVCFVLGSDIFLG